jgi:1-acyl-sn-glycerol-3-phosphate acyltransferase
MASSVSVSVFAVYKTLAISVPVLIETARGKLTPERVDALLDDWASSIVRAADVHLEVAGLDQVPADRAYVVMSNHQSHLDIPLIYAAWRRRLRMVAKAELFRIPVWGRAMQQSGFVSVDRSGNRANAEAAMRSCAQAITAGTSIWIAPEGTRSPTGKIARFKKGGFLLAQSTRAHIVPLSIDGSRDILPKHGRVLERGVRVKLTFSPPIDPAGRSLDALMGQVRSAIAAHVTEPLE